METFTAEEIAEIVHELGLPAEIEVNENGFVSIEVITDDLEWTINLGDGVPFYEYMQLGTVTTHDKDPLMYANRWNGSHAGTVQVIEDHETGALSVSEDGTYVLIMTWFIPFFGSVTKEYLEYVIAHWHEDVCELLKLEEVVDDEASNASVPVRGEHDPIDRLLQIQLELRLRAPQSSRELARSLKTTKYEVNNVLYHQPELFEKEGTSPPMWSNKGEIK